MEQMFDSLSPQVVGSKCGDDPDHFPGALFLFLETVPHFRKKSSWWTTLTSQQRMRQRTVEQHVELLDGDLVDALDEIPQQRVTGGAACRVACVADREGDP